jgi:prepilin-type N-terminal cleavage/methylation domain-containing protein
MLVRRAPGFTLVEIMIVVSVIALLATLAVPAFLRARQRAQNTRFINSLRVLRDAFDTYAAEHQGYPPDELRGVLPAVMKGYCGPTVDFSAPTPIGGNWDWDANQFGVAAGISVVSPTASLSQLQEIDTVIDDGDVSTGACRYIAAGRYTLVLE